MIIELAVTALLDNIKKSGAGYGVPSFTFGEKAISNAQGRCYGIHSGEKDVTLFAVMQAVHELLWSSASAGFDEEHQTASFMGHLSGNYGWYSLAANMQSVFSENPDHVPPVNLPEILWAAQSHKEESVLGSDFIVAAERDDGSYRVVLFQAKMFDGSIIKLWRTASACKNLAGETVCDENFFKLKQITGQDVSHTDFDTYNKLKKNGLLETGNYHQIHKVFNRQMIAYSLGAIDLVPDWCHYVFWYKRPEAKALKAGWIPRAPVCCPARSLLSEVFKKVGNAPRKLREADFCVNPSENNLKNSEVDFIKFLSDFMSGEDDSNSLRIGNAKKLKEFFNNLTNFARIPHYIVTDKGDGGGPALDDLPNAGYKITQSSITREAARKMAQFLINRAVQNTSTTQMTLG